ncbi:MAG: M23 family metallopeptidase [Bacteroidetes bacterium]|jgi:murein DD-endopeptidase MepM/ murein hydrolase activator NlpD|nr:M23 family metallopeptidase [Bacteroidota bacterium]
MVFPSFHPQKCHFLLLFLLVLLFSGHAGLLAQDQASEEMVWTEDNMPRRGTTVEPVEFEDLSSLSVSALRKQLAKLIPDLQIEGRRTLFEQLKEWRPDWFEHWEDEELFPDSTRSDTMPQTLRFVVLEDGEQLVYPWHGEELTWGYGPRNGHLHKGWDTHLEVGDTVVSLMNGVVRYAKFNHSGYGNCVMVRHFNGLETLYGHLDRIDVQQGDVLAAGEPLGLGGSTGKSSGPHLHFEVRYGGYALDPALIMEWSAEGPKSKTRILEIDKSQLSTEKGGESTSQAQSVGSKTHRVRSGETLSSIARKYKTTIPKLKKLNRLKNVDYIRLGQRLRVK